MSSERTERTAGAAAGVAAALLALACAAAGAAEVVVIDDEGREIRLAAPAQRIVSLAPHVTELLFAAGAGERIVGTLDYSDYPAQAKRIPRIGSSEAIQFEKLVALQPDLVIGWSSGNGPRTLPRLRALGLTVFASEIRTVGQIPETLERLGRIAGTGAEGERAAAEFRARLAALEAAYRDRPQVSVFYQIWNPPLMTVNGDHLISRAIEICSGRNVFAGLPMLTPHVSVEAVVAADPQIIIGGSVGGQRPAWLDEWRRYRQMQAVINGHLDVVPADLLHRPTPRFVDGVARLCEALERVRVNGGGRDKPAGRAPSK
ncbi:MAG: cobalamin-binding protein [Pseudomonadota bacterium]